MSSTGFRELEARLKALGEAQPMLRALQISAIAEIKKVEPRKTGHLGRSTVPGPVTKSTAVIAIRTPYAAAQDSGSGLHGPRHAKYPIVPKRAKVLAWGGGRRLSGNLRRGASATHFAARVMHPGVKGTHFVKRGVEAAVKGGGLRDVIIQTWNRAA